MQKKVVMYEYALPFCITLVSLISVHVRVFIFRKNAALYDLLHPCTFI